MWILLAPDDEHPLGWWRAHPQERTMRRRGGPLTGATMPYPSAMQHGSDAASGAAAVTDAFHRLYYGSHDTTWKQTYWLGRTVQKCPLNLWAYQEILYETRPDLIVETGTYMGGSALFMASVCDLLGNGKVVSMDIVGRRGKPRHRRITYEIGSSVAPDVVARVRRRARRAKRVMVVLDSDHDRDHVLRELALYGALVTPGCYIVVEDTNVNGHPVLPGHGPGPMEAVEAFLQTTDAFEVDRSRKKLLLSFNPSGYLRRR